MSRVNPAPRRRAPPPWRRVSAGEKRRLRRENPFVVVFLVELEAACNRLMNGFGRQEGAAGKRFALPYSRFLLHQLMGGVRGQASDIDIQAREIIRVGHIIDELLAKHTGKSVEAIEKDSERDFYMSAEEAKAYGLIDEIFIRDKLSDTP